MRNTKENKLIYEAYTEGKPEQVLLDDGEYKVIKINSINSAAKYSQNTEWGLKDRRMARGYMDMLNNMLYISKNGQPVAMALLDIERGEEQVRGPNNEDLSEDPKIRDLLNKAIQSDDKLLYDPRVLQDLF